MTARPTSMSLSRPEIEESGGCTTVRVRYGHFVPPPRRWSGVIERTDALLALLDREGESLRTLRPDPAVW